MKEKHKPSIPIIISNQYPIIIPAKKHSQSRKAYLFFPRRSLLSNISTARYQLRFSEEIFLSSPDKGIYSENLALKYDATKKAEKSVTFPRNDNERETKY